MIIIVFYFSQHPECHTSFICKSFPAYLFFSSSAVPFYSLMVSLVIIKAFGGFVNNY
jgi:hypothetical protein